VRCEGFEHILCLRSVGGEYFEDLKTKELEEIMLALDAARMRGSARLGFICDLVYILGYLGFLNDRSWRDGWYGWEVRVE
jgi:hypothetical protein